MFRVGVRVRLKGGRSLLYRLRMQATFVFGFLEGHEAGLSRNWVSELQFVEGHARALISQPMSKFDGFTVVRENQVALLTTC